MSLIELAERGFLPDWLIRIGIRRLLAKRLRQERSRTPSAQHAAEFAAALKQGPLALATDESKEQHYEVPAAFFETVLGPRLKYSSCLYSDPKCTLPDAEEAMLRLTCERAGVRDGMDVLDLGCGWGSLSLWIAEMYPNCRVVALSHSTGQRQFIEKRIAQKKLTNLRVITSNIVDYEGEARAYDRIISVEMFEHMRNYEILLGRIADWLRPQGKLFVHIFCHRDNAYPFEDNGKDDWMARHFFTGGLMPSFNLFDHFQRDLAVTQKWQVNGQHYARTCEDWLNNLDRHRELVLSSVERNGHHPSPKLFVQRWRIFFMACAELFRYGGGEEWFVGHYLFEPCSVATKRNAQSHHTDRDHTETTRDTLVERSTA